MPPELVVLGNLLVDDLAFSDGRTRMAEPGGAVLYAALAARLWNISVGAASVRGDDYPAWAWDALRARGVDLAGVRALGRPGLRTWLLYEERLRQVVHRLERPSHAEVSPGAADIPSDWRAARVFHIAPMPLPVQRELVASLSTIEGSFVSLDPYELFRRDTLDAWRDVLPGVDALFVSEDELLVGSGAEGALAVLLPVAGERLRAVAFKGGVRGGLLYERSSGRRVPWSARSAAVVDPTGAGDAFAAGVIAGWLRGEPAERALQRGIVGASFALEAWGPRRLIETTAAEAEARLADWYGT